MSKRPLTIADIILIAGTRVLMGVGIGLLISEHLTRDQRKTAGWVLFGVGAITTIPLAMNVVHKGIGSIEIAQKPAA